MKRVLINNLEGGEILAQEVCDQKGVQLLSTGTVYKNSYFKILKGLRIEHLYIQKNEKNKIYYNPEFLREQSRKLIKSQLRRFEKVGSINIYKFEKFVFTIMNELMESTHILDNMYTMQAFNNYTYEHSVHVTVIAIMMCNKMNISRYKTYEVAMGCMLHDLGKTKVPEEILDKPAKLTKEEFDEIKKHPVEGYQYIRDNRNLSITIQNIILTHHEKIDGSGYPLGLSGEDICMGARICAVADVFDAICSERPYKKAVPLPEAMRIMKATMNKELDMDICKILEEILKSTT